MQLRDPAHLVSSRAPVYWGVQGALTGLVLLAVAIVGSVMGWIDGVWRPLAIAAACVILLVGVVVVPVWRYRVHRWEVTPSAIYTQRGWITQERRIAPLSRVQTVDTERGPLAQLFGLSTVTVTTASAKGEMKIEALDRAVAQRIVADLTDATSAGRDDAT